MFQCQTCLTVDFLMQLATIIKLYTCIIIEFCRLQRISVCLSYDTTLNMMDTIAESYDEQIHDWKDQIFFLGGFPPFLPAP